MADSKKQLTLAVGCMLLVIRALKIYLARYGTLQEAITRIEEDRKADGGLLYLEFARKVNQHQKVMSLW